MRDQNDEFRPSEKDYIRDLIIRCKKNDKDAQKEMYEYLKKVITPVAYSLKAIGEKCGLNKEDFDCCIYDAMFGVIFKQDVKNIKNFKSYFKTSYKFSLIAKIRDNLHFYKNFILGMNLDGEVNCSEIEIDLTRRDSTLVPHQQKELILEIMYDAQKYFSTTEYTVLLLVMEGFTLNEIMVTLNMTKYRVYRAYDDAISRLKDIIKTLFPIPTK